MKLGRDLLRRWGTLFSPETILRWNRWFIGRKYDGSGKRGPAPRKANSVRTLVLEMGRGQTRPGGYGHIHGETQGPWLQGVLGRPCGESCWTTGCCRIRTSRTDPRGVPSSRATGRASPRATSSRLRPGGLKGLTRCLVFLVIELATRKVEIIGIHADPCETQMIQWARNLTDEQDGFLKDKRILIHDRDSAVSRREFSETLRAAGVRALKLPKRASEPESVFRTLRAFHKTRVSRQDDLLW